MTSTLHSRFSQVRSARFVAEGLRSAKGSVPGAERKVVVFAGAMVPEAMKDSDAAINIGAALGCISTMRLLRLTEEGDETSDGGVFIAMGGRVLKAENCTRHPSSHHFVDE